MDKPHNPPLLTLVSKLTEEPTLAEVLAAVKEANQASRTLGDGVLVVVAELQRRRENDSTATAERGLMLRRLGDLNTQVQALTRNSAVIAKGVTMLEASQELYMGQQHLDALNALKASAEAKAAAEAAADLAASSMEASHDAGRQAVATREDTAAHNLATQAELAAAGDVAKLQPWAQVAKIVLDGVRKIELARLLLVLGFLATLAVGYFIRVAHTGTPATCPPTSTK